ncbi:MAG: protocatechuate 3,4-dioxygenase subunit beta, partial [Mycobacterium sp.]
MADTAGLATQREITAEITEIGAASRGGQPDQSRLNYAPYRSSVLRHPHHPMQLTEPHDLERSAPCFGERDIAACDADLTLGHAGEPIGERIIVAGRVTDEDGRAV